MAGPIFKSAPTRQELDAIGVQDPAQPTPLTSADLDPDKGNEVLQEFHQREFDQWEVSMLKERNILKRAFEQMPKPLSLGFATHKAMNAGRMRLYRCKRLLIDKGNRSVMYLSFSVEGKVLTIGPTEDLESLIIEDES